MKSIRPPAPKPNIARRAVERVRAWTRQPVGCGTCAAVRRAAGKVVDAVAPTTKTK